MGGHVRPVGQSRLVFLGRSFPFCGSTFGPSLTSVNRPRAHCSTGDSLLYSHRVWRSAAGRKFCPNGKSCPLGVRGALCVRDRAGSLLRGRISRWVLPDQRIVDRQGPCRKAFPKQTDYLARGRAWLWNRWGLRASACRPPRVCPPWRGPECLYGSRCAGDRHLVQPRP
jgi:hypothetical protein